MSNASLRCFLAIFLTADVRNRLAKEIRRLREVDDQIKWVEPENLHVTLKFLGQITEADVVRLSRSMQERARAFAPLSADVCGLGAFPSLRVPRTIWAGFAEGSESLTELGTAIEDECSRLGFKRENRPFTPHITLGRRKADSPAQRLAELLHESVDVEFGVLMVSEFCLVTSNLRRSGPTYVPIATFALAQ